MFFWKKKDYFKYCFHKKILASLRACHTQIDPNKCDSPTKQKRIKNRKFKRTFSFTPSCYQASMCLETSLSFSFFMLFMVNVFSIIFLFVTYTQDLSVLQQQGKKAAAYAYVTEGIFGGNENICLQKNRVIKSPFALLSAPDCRLHVKCVVKPWTGYDVTVGKNRNEEDMIVYMTEHGSVYHKNRSCTHLSLSIQAIASTLVSAERNESGERYYSCEYCGDRGFVTVVFITSHGNRYHTTAKCRGLKRSVKTLRLSEAEGVNPCQKCG